MIIDLDGLNSRVFWKHPEDYVFSAASSTSDVVRRTHRLGSICGCGMLSTRRKPQKQSASDIGTNVRMLARSAPGRKSSIPCSGLRLVGLAAFIFRRIAFFFKHFCRHTFHNNKWNCIYRGLRKVFPTDEHPPVACLKGSRVFGGSSGAPRDGSQWDFARLQRLGFPDQSEMKTRA